MHHARSTSASIILSQHFLREPRIAREIVDLLEAQPGSLAVDVGAGEGILAAALVDAGFRVIVVEKDVRLYRRLRARFIGRTNVECHLTDVRAWQAPREPHAVVSNVPYGITADVLRWALAGTATEALLIVQAEAAAKIAGVPRETRSALLRKPWWQAEIVRRFDPCDFVPAPAVESALLRLRRRDESLVPERLRGRYEEFVTRAFGSRRQRARDALRLMFTERQLVRLMRDLRIPRDARPSEIAFPQWLALFRFHAGSRIGRDPCADRPRWRRVVYRKRSRSASRTIPALVASSEGVKVAPRTTATGTRSSLPCTSSAVAASSSTTAICVTRSS